MQALVLKLFKMAQEGNLDAREKLISMANNDQAVLRLIRNIYNKEERHKIMSLKHVDYQSVGPRWPYKT